MRSLRPTRGLSRQEKLLLLLLLSLLLLLLLLLLCQLHGIYSFLSSELCFSFLHFLSLNTSSFATALCQRINLWQGRIQSIPSYVITKVPFGPVLSVWVVETVCNKKNVALGETDPGEFWFFYY